MWFVYPRQILYYWDNDSAGRSRVMVIELKLTKHQFYDYWVLTEQRG